MFDQNKNLYDEKSVKFIERQEQARKEQEYKNKGGHMIKLSGKKWDKGLRSSSMNQTSILKSSSMMNVKTIKKNLHEELHSLTIYNDDY